MVGALGQAFVIMQSCPHILPVKGENNFFPFFQVYTRVSATPLHATEWFPRLARNNLVAHMNMTDFRAYGEPSVTTIGYWKLMHLLDTR